MTLPTSDTLDLARLADVVATIALTHVEVERVEQAAEDARRRAHEEALNVAVMRALLPKLLDEDVDITTASLPLRVGTLHASAQSGHWPHDAESDARRIREGWLYFEPHCTECGQPLGDAMYAVWICGANNSASDARHNLGRELNHGPRRCSSCWLKAQPPATDYGAELAHALVTFLRSHDVDITIGG